MYIHFSLQDKGSVAATEALYNVYGTKYVHGTLAETVCKFSKRRIQILKLTFKCLMASANHIGRVHFTFPMLYPARYSETLTSNVPTATKL